MRTTLTLVGFLLLCCSVCSAKPDVGLFGLLRNVHAYSDGESTYVPLLGIADWVGAAVEIKKPDVTVTLAGTRLKLTMGSAVCFSDASDPVVMPQSLREIGGIICVPARFWETLGVATEYVTVSPNFMGDGGPMNAADKMGTNAVLVFSHRDRSATVLIHLAPPAVVSKVITDLENSNQASYDGCDAPSGRYGLDWIVRVGQVSQDHFEGDVPAELAGSATDLEHACFLQGGNSCIYGVRQGKWRLLLVTDYKCPWMDGMPLIFARKDWIAASIPFSLAHQWQIRFK